MPVIFSKRINAATQLIVWHATEEVPWLRNQLELDPDDESRFQSITNQNRKRQWLGCRMALSHLMDTPRIPIRYDQYGKPSLASWEAEISFTHTGLYAAAICSHDSRPGIDLEQVRDKISRVAARFLTPGELSMISGKDYQLTLLTLFWAAKETLYKINGKPDLELQHDLRIESFDYLCFPEGELLAKMKLPDSEPVIPVSYHLVEGMILTWATLPANT